MNQNTNPYHSDKLREHFPINMSGVDYINPFDINIEFKESFSSKPRISDIIFKVHHSQLLDSDIIVFCHHTTTFYVHKAKYLKNKHYHENVCRIQSFRGSAICRNYLYKSTDYKDLKQYLDNLKEV